MESNSVPGRVLVTEATAQLLVHSREVHLEERGVVDIKGKGWVGEGGKGKGGERGLGGRGAGGTGGWGEVAVMGTPKHVGAGRLHHPTLHPNLLPRCQTPLTASTHHVHDQVFTTTIRYPTAYPFLLTPCPPPPTPHPLTLPPSPMRTYWLQRDHTVSREHSTMVTFAAASAAAVAASAGFQRLYAATAAARSSSDLDPGSFAAASAGGGGLPRTPSHLGRLRGARRMSGGVRGVRARRPWGWLPAAGEGAAAGAPLHPALHTLPRARSRYHRGHSGGSATSSGTPSAPSHPNVIASTLITAPQTCDGNAAVAPKSPRPASMAAMMAAALLPPSPGGTPHVPTTPMGGRGGPPPAAGVNGGGEGGGEEKEAPGQTLNIAPFLSTYSDADSGPCVCTTPLPTTFQGATPSWVRPTPSCSSLFMLNTALGSNTSAVGLPGRFGVGGVVVGAGAGSAGAASDSAADTAASAVDAGTAAGADAAPSAADDGGRTLAGVADAGQPGANDGGEGQEGGVSGRGSPLEGGGEGGGDSQGVCVTACVQGSTDSWPDSSSTGRGRVSAAIKGGNHFEAGRMGDKEGGGGGQSRNGVGVGVGVGEVKLTVAASP